MVFPDGSTYRGNFDNNSFNGSGKFIYKSKLSSDRNSAAPHQSGNELRGKSSYEGEWVDNLPHGMGKEFFDDGSSY